MNAEFMKVLGKVRQRRVRVTFKSRKANWQHQRVSVVLRSDSRLEKIKTGPAPVIEENNKHNKHNVPNCVKLFSTQTTLSTFHSRTWLSGLMKCRIHQTFEVVGREP